MNPEHDSLALCNSQPLTISALNRLARDALERNLPLVWVAGEVSNMTRAASGHVYFSLKDQSAQVRCVMFRNRAQLLPFRIREGERVEARALATLYEVRGDFQLNVESLRQGGVGALYEAFARLRDKLDAEGLFAAAHHRPLPKFPRCIGVVTSLQAAALHDILATLTRRAPHIRVAVFPAAVQGDGAAQQIAAGIGLAGACGHCDVVIVARGGGNIEDLWAFNEEIVARAIHACQIPVVTGIGHESDITIADLVADLRAATPTAAAEQASAGFVEATQCLLSISARLRKAIHRTIEARMQRADVLSGRLTHPGERLARLRTEVSHRRTGLISSLRLRLGRHESGVEQIRTRLAATRPDLSRAERELGALGSRMENAVARRLAEHRTALIALGTNLAHLSPQRVLLRGYSIARTHDGTVVRSSEQVCEGDVLRLTFGRGDATARVTGRHDD